MSKKKKTISSRSTEKAAAGLRPAAAALSEATPAPGPFEANPAVNGRANDLVRAFATGLLVMYPVAAIVCAIVAASALLGFDTPA
ncbi:MAG: hypothetical protein AB7I79_17055 [Rhizobiaceae bacterium]